MSKRTLWLDQDEFLSNLREEQGEKQTYSDIAIPSKTFYLPEKIKAFLKYKSGQGIRDVTIKLYIRDFNDFAHHLKSENVNFESLKQAVQEYFTTKADKAPATYNIPYTNLNSFFNWAVEIEGILPKNPLKHLAYTKKKDLGRVRHIPEEEVKKLLKVIKLTTYAGYRDYCIIMITLDTGIRPNELFQLKVSDYNPDNRTLFVSKFVSKTHMDRTLPLSPQVVKLIDKLVDIKNEAWGDLLIYSYEGEPMTTKVWEKRMYQYNKEAGTKIAPYDFRHTFAIMFLRNNGNMFALQTLLGHTDLTMTKRYVKLAQSDIENQHGKATPVNNFIRSTTRATKANRTKR